MNIVEELCQDHKKNLFIQKNKQLLRMAHIELISFQTVLRRIQSNKKVNEQLENEEESLDENMIKGYLEDELNCQKYRCIDKNIIDYLDSPHSMAVQNSDYIKIENNRESILAQQLQQKNMIKLSSSSKFGYN